MHRNALAHACRVALGSIGLVVLAGCGGGGGSDTVVRPDPPPAAPPADPVVYDPNPAFSKHLTVTNTQVAHAAGFTGEGVRIGVVMVLSTLIPLIACGYLLDRWLARRGVA